jgi:superfamily I DNA and/or RNA helicase
MRLLPRGKLPPDKAALLPHLWRTLFLVTPVVSTTFASVRTLIGALPEGTLGWLVVDEAGQALPQAAVGSLLRTRRAVIVGDPLQLPPVVTLPWRLTRSICRAFGVDAERFAAPEASVQTLADAASPLTAEFPTREGSRQVGAPLLVHRRCDEPMFSVANAIAYAGLMVNAKPREDSPFVRALGPSRWIDVKGSGSSHWQPEEGEVVVSLLKQMRAAGLPPDAYVITPFRLAAQELRERIARAESLRGWLPEDWVSQRVGTVYVVQGREAPVVIMVLGAAGHQAGARAWVGRTPNQLNVAVTRAQQAFYVVGSRNDWRAAGVFAELDSRLP